MKGHHAIIYTIKDEPQPENDELPNVATNEAPMLDSIRAVSIKKSDTMHKMSRINYAKIYTVEHNVKVYDFGKVHRDSKHVLRHQFNQVWRISAPEDDEEDSDEEVPKPEPKNKGKSTRRSKR
jgi:hypothetical protein